MYQLLKRKLRNLTSDKKFSEILTGSVWAFGARVIATALGLLTTLIIARFYGADVLGLVTIINSFLLLSSIFTMLGTETSILRLIPEHLVRFSPTSAFRLYRKTQFMVMGISAATAAVFYFCSGPLSERVFSKPHLSPYLALAAVFVVFKSLMLLNTKAVRGLHLIRIFALMQALPSLSNLIILAPLTVFFYTRDNPVYAYLFSLAITGVAGWAVMQHAFRRRMQAHDTVSDTPMKTILAISLPMLFTTSMHFAITQTGVIILGIFRSEAEVGYYSVAAKLATLTVFILQAINSMAAPRFSELFHSGNIDDLFHVAKKSAKLIFWTTSPILLGLVLLGKPVLKILFGADFAVAYPALVLLALGQFVNSASGSTGFFMNMTGDERGLSIASLVAAIINILLNVMLIPIFGMNGAALAGMVSLAFWNINILVMIKMKYGRTIGYFPNPLHRRLSGC